MTKRRILQIIAGTVATLGVMAGCKFNDMGKKKVDDQNGNLSLNATAGMCGTVTSLGELQGNQASLVVSVVICGQLPDDDHGPWKALGLSVTTPKVYMHREGTAMDPSNEQMAEVLIENNKVFAVHHGDRVQIGSVESTSEGAAVKYHEGIKVAIGVEGQPIDYKQAKAKAPGDYEVFVTPR